mgnify:CR=1 FL=1
MSPSRIGGSFAPPLDDNKIGEYRKLAEKAPRPILDAMMALCDMVDVFYETPRSAMPSFPDRTGVALITPLETDKIELLDPHVPWKHELDGYASIFDTLDPKDDKKLRDAAFHLL